MDKKVYQLILGSASPRRKELLKHAYLNFEIITSDLEEISHFEKPVEIVKDLALQKAKHVFEACNKKNPFVIGADTIVVIDEKILGKPNSREDAKEMLLSLSNKTHHVYTGVAFVWDGKECVFYDSTQVSFCHIDNDLLNFYLDTGESMDKAGSYGIQGAALGFIDRVNGSYSNVVGLPVDKVLLNLKKVMNSSESWRNRFC